MAGATKFQQFVGRGCMAALAMCALVSGASPAAAQQTDAAILVPACGSITHSGQNGAIKPLTQTADGKLCVSGGSGGGGGDASAANQSTQITAEQAIQAEIGAVSGSPAANTLQARMAAQLSAITALGTGGLAMDAHLTSFTSANHTDLAQLHTDATAATPAGENHTGEVGGKTIIVGANFTTPSGTSAYASGNLIANSATAGSVTPLDFTTACRVSQGTGMVRRARIKTPDTGFAGKALTLALYRDSPTVTNGDHAAWLSIESNYIGSIPVTLDQHFSDAEKGIGAPAAGSEINFDCASSSQHLYGLVVAGGAITPQGAKTITVVLEILAN